MRSHDFSVGESVFCFSENLREVVKGSVEGFDGEQRLRVKVLQETEDGLIRHIVSWFYVFKEESSARDAASEFEKIRRDEHSLYPKGFHEIVYLSGMTVHLLQGDSLVADRVGNPYVYQIVKVYRNSERVSLVNSYGESVGTFSFSEVVLCSRDPIFKSTDYQLGQRVSWTEGEDVYEGIISNLRDSTAEVVGVKKLYPLDYKKSLPYYKLVEEDLFTKNNCMILTSIVGDNIEE